MQCAFNLTLGSSQKFFFFTKILLHHFVVKIVFNLYFLTLTLFF